MGRFQRPFLFQSPPPLRSAKGSLLNPSSVGSTRRAQNLSMYQGVIQLCPDVGAGAGCRRSACQRHRPGSHPQPYTTDERCPWKALGSSKCGTRRSASGSVLEAIKAGYPVFEHRDLANICETTVLCLLHTRVSRQTEKPCLHIQCRQGFWKGRYPFTGKSRLFQEQEDSSDSPSLIKAKLVLPAQFLHQVHGESLATAWMFHEP